MAGTTNEIKVFQNRPVAESAERREQTRSNELSLVSERRAEDLRSQIDELFEESEDASSRIEGEEKSTGFRAVRHRVSNLFDRVLGELRVGVQEHQHITFHHCGAAVELSAPTGRARGRDGTACGGYVEGPVSTTAVADDDLVGNRERRVQTTLEGCFFVECWDDNCNSQGGADASIATLRTLPMASFSHLDDSGRAQMVNVTEKRVTRRIAEASCHVRLAAETVARLADLPKGDAYTVARLAGIQGAKKTSELIPLAHPLPIDSVKVEIEPVADGVVIQSRVEVEAKTGVEMEALTACAAAALALYDMVKAVERDAEIGRLRLDSKSGGRSGDFRRAE